MTHSSPKTTSGRVDRHRAACFRSAAPRCPGESCTTKPPSRISGSVVSTQSLHQAYDHPDRYSKSQKVGTRKFHHRNRGSMSTRTKEYILTDSGNHISRRGLNLINTQAIVLGGKTIIASHVTIRGDLKRPSPSVPPASRHGSHSIDGAVIIGRYCVLEDYTQLIPPHQPVRRGTRTDAREEAGGEGHEEADKVYTPMTLGDYVRIGQRSKVSASSIASYVDIGCDCVIGNMCVVREGCIIEDGTLLPPGTNLAPFSRVRGRPGLVVAETPEVTVDVLRERLRQNYARVVAAK